MGWRERGGGEGVYDKRRALWHGEALGAADALRDLPPACAQRLLYDLMQASSQITLHANA